MIICFRYCDLLVLLFIGLFLLGLVCLNGYLCLLFCCCYV